MQIFLSYSRQDSEAAETLATALGDRGHNVWWDKNIGGGSKFAAEIEHALNRADVVMVLWSSASITSPWVLDEAAEGRDSDRLIPVALDDSKPPLGFRQYQTISAQGAWIGAAMDEIVQSIARKSGEEQKAPAALDHRTPPAPDSPEALCARARQLEAQGRFDEAEREIQAALRTDPESWAANREAAVLKYTQGKAADAIPFCEKAIVSLKGDHESAALLISCYRAIHDDEGSKHAAEIAVSRAEHAVASTSATGPAIASVAKGLAALGHSDRSRKWVKKALNIDPGNLPMRYKLAATLAAFLNDAEAALEVLEPFIENATDRTHLQLLETDPDWSSIRELSAFRSLVARARRRVEALEATRFPTQPPSTV